MGDVDHTRGAVTSIQLGNAEALAGEMVSQLNQEMLPGGANQRSGNQEMLPGRANQRSGRFGSS